MAFVRYQTVRNIVIGAVVIGGFVVIGVMLVGDDEPEPQPIALVSPTRAPYRSDPKGAPRLPPADPGRPAVPATPRGSDLPAEEPAPSPAPTPTNADRLAAIARVMLDETASSKKVKDYFRGSGPKVNLYDDDRDGRWDRAKIDYDRDDADDDKLTFKGGTIERKIVATGEVQVWDNGTWRPKK